MWKLVLDCNNRHVGGVFVGFDFLGQSPERAREMVITAG
jgi:hypothetical protein